MLIQIILQHLSDREFSVQIKASKALGFFIDVEGEEVTLLPAPPPPPPIYYTITSVWWMILGTARLWDS